MTTDETTGTWRKSTKCESGGCVEISATDSHVLVRTSTTPEERELRFTHQQWSEFLGAIHRTE